jgi:hypothetical protein
MIIKFVGAVVKANKYKSAKYEIETEGIPYAFVLEECSHDLLGNDKMFYLDVSAPGIEGPAVRLWCQTSAENLLVYQHRSGLQSQLHTITPGIHYMFLSLLKYHIECNIGRWKSPYFGINITKNTEIALIFKNNDLSDFNPFRSLNEIDHNTYVMHHNTVTTAIMEVMNFEFLETRYSLEYTKVIFANITKQEIEELRQGINLALNMSPNQMLSLEEEEEGGEEKEEE